MTEDQIGVAGASLKQGFERLVVEPQPGAQLTGKGTATDPSEGGHQSKRVDQAPMFPRQRNLELPLLKTLSEVPGGLPWRKALDKLCHYYRKLTVRNVGDYTRGGRPGRWKSLVRNCRGSLISKGQIDPAAPRGAWRISEAGRQRLDREWPSWAPEYAED